jgi:hypothetical protein
VSDRTVTLMVWGPAGAPASCSATSEECSPAGCRWGCGRVGVPSCAPTATRAWGAVREDGWTGWGGGLGCQWPGVPVAQCHHQPASGLKTQDAPDSQAQCTASPCISAAHGTM